MKLGAKMNRAEELLRMMGQKSEVGAQTPSKNESYSKVSVNCNVTDCRENTDGKCQSGEINIVDGVCQDNLKY